MFAARGIGVSLALFVLLYIPLSLVISRGWRLLRQMVKPGSARDSAHTLFVLRILPFALSSIFTVVFTLPSFLLLEPRASDESVGTIPVALGLCCLLVMAAGILKAMSAQRATSRALMKWLDGSTVMEPDSPVPVFRTGTDAPTLTVAGVCEPKVLVSEAAIAALSPSELRTALKHELAHVRSHDNLKKLIFRLSAFPGMAGLERAWSEEAELAADDAAVASCDDALDLASALIKVSRLGVAQPSPALTTGLLHSSTALHLRVQRLFSWSNRHASSRSGRGRLFALLSTAATLVLVVTTYSSALSQLHVVTEWLVR
jgi:Zn-dependent protease with chaperone function